MQRESQTRPQTIENNNDERQAEEMQADGRVKADRPRPSKAKAGGPQTPSFPQVLPVVQGILAHRLGASPCPAACGLVSETWLFEDLASAPRHWPILLLKVAIPWPSPPTSSTPTPTHLLLCPQIWLPSPSIFPCAVDAVLASRWPCRTTAHANMLLLVPQGGNLSQICFDETKQLCPMGTMHSKYEVICATASVPYTLAKYIESFDSRTRPLTPFLPRTKRSWKWKDQMNGTQFIGIFDEVRFMLWNSVL